MAELNPFINYGAAMGDAARIPGDIANQWATQRKTQEEGTEIELRNRVKKMVMPLIQQGIADYNNPQSVDDSNGNDPLLGPVLGKDSIGSGAQPTRDQAAPQLVQGDGSQPPDLAGTINTATNTTPTEDTQDPAEVRRSKITASTDKSAAQTLAPVPTHPPMNSPTLKLARAFAMAGDPESVARAENLLKTYETGAESENERRVKLANTAYGTASDVANAPADKAWAVMKQVAPNEAKKILATHPGMTGSELKEYMTAAGSSAFLYTKRGVKLNNDGYVADAQTGMRILGHDYRVGLSQDQFAAIVTDLQTPQETWDTNGHPTKIPKYQLLPNGRGGMGFPSASAAALSIAEAAARNPTSTGQGATGPIQDGTAPATSGAAPTAAPVAAPVPPASGGGKGQQASSLNSPTGSFDLSDFPSKPSVTGGGFNKGPSNEQTSQATTYTPVEIRIKQEKGEGVLIDNDGMTRDRKVLALLPRISTGPMAARLTAVQNLVSEIGSAFGNKTMGDLKGADPAAWNVVNKLLGQSATANFKESGAGGESGQTRVSGLLYQIGMEQLAANTAINKDAIKQMLQYDIAQRAYRVQKDGPDFQATLKARKDVTNFDNIYGAKHPQDAAMKRYMTAMDDKGNIDTKKGSAVNPYTVESASDVSKLPHGVYVYTHDGRLGYRK